MELSNKKDRKSFINHFYSNLRVNIAVIGLFGISFILLIQSNFLGFLAILLYIALDKMLNSLTLMNKVRSELPYEIWLETKKEDKLFANFLKYRHLFYLFFLGLLSIMFGVIFTNDNTIQQLFATAAIIYTIIMASEFNRISLYLR